MIDKAIRKNPVMNPLILQYKERSNNEGFDFSQIEYSLKLNLTIDKKTGLPAINFLNMSTETHTRTYNESSDCDSENMGLMMGTKAMTFTELESSDDDRGFSTVKSMRRKSSVTLVFQESTDND